jgi:hypothetical protein
MKPSNSDRRKFNRAKGRGSATIIRDTDMMRNGIQGELEDISHAGLSFFLPTCLKIGEHVSIELENPIQRTSVQTRGCVKWIQDADGGYRIGCSLMNWLVPQQVLALKSHLAQAAAGR